MTLGEEILRDKVARLSDPVEWLIQQVLLERRRAIEAEAPCEHEHWFKDEDRDHRPIRICEDCGKVIFESDVKREEP